MKKFFFSAFTIICILLTFSGCFNHGYISENKNDFKISEQDIEGRMLYNSFTNTVNKAFLKEVFADVYEEEYKLVALPENADEIEKSLIADNVIIEHCKEKDIFIDKERTTQTAKEEFELLNSDEAQELYASFVHKTLLEYNLSEEEYIELLCEKSYYHYNKIALKSYFGENLYESNSVKSLNEQFDDYVDALVQSWDGTAPCSE